MIKKFALATIVFTALSGAALAVNVTPPASATTATNTSSATALNSLDPSAGTPRNGKVDYDSLTRAEKIKYINDKHVASEQKRIAKWKGMTDDQKIAQYEKRRNAFIARRATKNQQNASIAAPTTAASSAATLEPAAGAVAPRPSVVPSLKSSVSVKE